MGEEASSGVSHSETATKLGDRSVRRGTESEHEPEQEQEYGRNTSWFRCERSELILGEQRPRAFAFLPHDRGPILGCRIEGVDIHELAVGVIEGEIDGVGGFVEGAVTEYSRGAPAKDIEPMQNVARHFVIEPDKGHRFVLGRGRDVEIMQLEELMVEHPADAHRVLGGAAVAEFSNNTPVADQFIQQRILELDVASVRGSWGLRAHRDSEEREGDEQGKTLHAAIMTDFHLSRDARNGKVFR